MPIVLTQNESTADGKFDFWEDIEGEQYHYPNTYRNLIRAGERFVYYRSAGRGRSIPEYFGWGTVAAVEPDQRTEKQPARRRRWYCFIEDYVRFTEAVPFKLDGKYLESTGRTTPVKARHHSNGVRRLEQPAYEAILRLAELNPRAPTMREAGNELPDLDSVTIPTSTVPLDQLVLAREARKGKSGGRNGYSGRRTSHQSKAIGDLAEGVVCRFLENDPLARNVEWLARRGETPGWDLQYVDSDGRLVRVEVKGTTQERFSSIELTRNEWEAAEMHRDSYHIYLVNSCVTQTPQITFINDPVETVRRGDHELHASRWTMVL